MCIRDRPEGVRFDEVGRGHEEGKRNFAEAEPDVAQQAVAMLREMTSPGYMRKRVPQGLLELRGGVSATVLETTGGAALAVEETVDLAIDARSKAKMQGYEGDPCGECGNFTLVRNGTCLKCNTCGGTSGCS